MNFKYLHIAFLVIVGIVLIAASLLNHENNALQIAAIYLAAISFASIAFASNFLDSKPLTSRELRFYGVALIAFGILLLWPIQKVQNEIQNIENIETFERLKIINANIINLNKNIKNNQNLDISEFGEIFAENEKKDLGSFKVFTFAMGLVITFCNLGLGVNLISNGIPDLKDNFYINKFPDEIIEKLDDISFFLKCILFFSMFILAGVVYLIVS
ncbi:hypothetical protein [Trichloromonas acetexigens]|uniref:Uncharacterized protein n=1 Tax=Trichloromonas acetexigens TaxID=38815 RepID=A0A550JK75_9BACT|nr:hypothetical protein [Desulfuromonas acetexigens]TRO83602.1 hypothetical protein FL622_00005 [Desulfuromonas acetexigens]